MIKSTIYNAGSEGLFPSRPGVCPSRESETVTTEFLREAAS